MSEGVSGAGDTSGAGTLAPAESRRALLAQARQRARAEKRPVLATWIEPAPADVTPLEVFARATGADDRVYWSCPDEGIALAAVGTAATVAPSGSERRFASAARLWRALREGLVRGAADGVPEPVAAAAPILAGGFSFDPEREATPLWLGFPDAWLAVPRLCLQVTPEGRWLTTSALVRPSDQDVPLAEALEREEARLVGGAPDERAEAWELIASAFERRGEPPPVTEESIVAPDAWRESVRAAAAAVRDGALLKVVLARAVRRRGGQRPVAATALARLEARFPGCHVFAVARGRRIFLGATPERLVRLSRGVVQATALAGSIRRGATPDEDAALVARLEASAKDRHEHELVVRGLTSALADVTDDLRVPPAPVPLTMSNVHHLYTPVRARLRAGHDLLDLVARLHPTAAVGGLPRDAALAYLRDHEPLDRGWYAAPVGWIGADGDGEFAVALRSALLEAEVATLFAGCGVVGDSDPDEEYEESEIKLRPMRQALGDVG